MHRVIHRNELLPGSSQENAGDRPEAQRSRTAGPAPLRPAADPAGPPRGKPPAPIPRRAPCTAPGASAVRPARPRTGCLPSRRPTRRGRTRVARPHNRRTTARKRVEVPKTCDSFRPTSATRMKRSGSHPQHPCHQGGHRTQPPEAAPARPGHRRTCRRRTSQRRSRVERFVIECFAPSFHVDLAPDGELVTRISADTVDSILGNTAGETCSTERTLRRPRGAHPP